MGTVLFPGRWRRRIHDDRVRDDTRGFHAAVGRELITRFQSRQYGRRALLTVIVCGTLFPSENAVNHLDGSEIGRFEKNVEGPPGFL
jgi:hypothetical protein